jgi:RNA polymerase sigma factor (TIGR02999 family)
MTGADAEVIVRTLDAGARGDPHAAATLLPLVYGELKKLAHARLAKLPSGQTLNTTALVHEAYLRVVGPRDPGWSHRGHFFAAAAQAMRNILVDQARRKCSLKRGGGRKPAELVDAEDRGSPLDDILAIHEAVARLEAVDPRKGQIVNLRFFAGLTEEETAATLGVSRDTVKREWRYTKRWLYCVLKGDDRVVSLEGRDGR